MLTCPGANGEHTVAAFANLLLSITTALEAEAGLGAELFAPTPDELELAPGAEPPLPAQPVRTPIPTTVLMIHPDFAIFMNFILLSHQQFLAPGLKSALFFLKKKDLSSIAFVVLFYVKLSYKILFRP